MELKVLKEKDMKLLSRKRVSLMLENQKSTPSRKILIPEVAKKFKVKGKDVIIKHIYPQFGNSNVKIIANIYEDEKKKGMFEHKNLLTKHVVEEPVTEEKTVEAPVQETTEETKEQEIAEELTGTEAQETVETPSEATAEEVEETVEEAVTDAEEENKEASE